MASTLLPSLIAELPDGSAFENEAARLTGTQLSSPAGIRILERLPIDTAVARIKRTDAGTAIYIASELTSPELLTALYAVEKRKTILAVIRCNRALPANLADEAIRDLISTLSWEQLGLMLNKRRDRVLPAISGHPGLPHLLTYGVSQDRAVKYALTTAIRATPARDLPRILGTGPAAAELIEFTIDGLPKGSANTRWVAKVGDTFPFGGTREHPLSDDDKAYASLKRAIAIVLARSASTNTTDLLRRYPWAQTAEALVHYRPSELSFGDVEPLLDDDATRDATLRSLVRNVGRADARMFEYLLSIENAYDVRRSCNEQVGTVNDPRIVTMLTDPAAAGGSTSRVQTLTNLHAAAVLVLTDDLAAQLIACADPELLTTSRLVITDVQRRVTEMPSSTVAALLRTVAGTSLTLGRKIADALTSASSPEDPLSAEVLDAIAALAIVEADERETNTPAAGILWTRLPLTAAHLGRMLDAVENNGTTSPHALLHIIVNSGYWTLEREPTEAEKAEASDLMDRVLEVGRKVRNASGNTYLEAISRLGHLPAMLAGADGHDLAERHPDAAQYVAARVLLPRDELNPVMHGVVSIAPVDWSSATNPHLWAAAGKYLASELGENQTELATALGLINDWDGTLVDLVAAARTL
jgi:hypothetical protein